MSYQEILAVYKKIMEKEGQIMEWDNVIDDAEPIYNAANQLLEIAYSMLVPRSYVPEEQHAKVTGSPNISIAAHTFLMSAMLDRALTYYEEQEQENIYDIFGYTYREIMEAARQHDLPENVIGDHKDNGTRDNEGLATEEIKYWEEFSKYSIRDEDSEFDAIVLELLKDSLDYPTSDIATVMHLADKFSSVIEMLVCDAAGVPVYKSYGDADLSADDLALMELCDSCESGKCRASEVYTASFLHQRQLGLEDEIGFFVGVIVMATLLVRGKWYNWREADYDSH